MRGRVCLVTGANRGIGREIALGLARAGARVLVHARTADKVDAAVAGIRSASGNDLVQGFPADFMDQAQVRRLATEVQAATDRLDVLVNNAATYNKFRQMTADGHEGSFAVNHLAPFVLTRALKTLLRDSAPSRVVNVSSEAHQRASNIEDWESRQSYSAYQAYARSKLANVLFSYDLAHRLEGTGVTVNACHPGLVDTGIIDTALDHWYSRWLIPIAKRIAIPVEEGATTPLWLAVSADVEGVTGKYFKQQKATASSLVSHDATIGARLWNISLRYTGEVPEQEITGEHIAH
jgi:NAD(P)-dependent dehydrogenase (short-subunit alcohol dehydrogenase family)